MKEKKDQEDRCWVCLFFKPIGSVLGECHNPNRLGGVTSIYETCKDLRRKDSGMIKRNVLPKNQCSKCRYYPNVCGYWDKNLRKSNKDASFVTADHIHNCHDFRLDITKLKKRGG